MNIKQIVIALIDRLAAYAAREADNENPEERKKGEEEAARRLAERVKGARIAGKGHQSPPVPAEEPSAGIPGLTMPEGNAWGSEDPSFAETGHDIRAPDTASIAAAEEDTKEEHRATLEDRMTPPTNDTTDSTLSTSLDKGKGKEGNIVKKFRGIPEDVKLFEVFWQQIVQLIRASRLPT